MLSSTHSSDPQPPKPDPARKARTIPFLAAIGLFGLALGFLINVLDPFLYTEKVRLLAPPWIKNTALSFITIMSLFVALAAQPLVGRWSDRTRTRWGRRAPFLVAGVIAVSVSLTLVVSANSFWFLLPAAMLISASSNTVQGTWQALIPDQVIEGQRGTASGIKTLLEVIGVVIGATLTGAMLAQGNLWAAPLTAIGLFWIVLLITLYTIRRKAEPPVSGPTPQQSNEVDIAKRTLQATSHLAKLLAVYKLIHAVPGFSWWMLNRFLFWSAAIAIRTFMLNYMEDVHAISPAQAQLLSSRIFLVLGIGVFLLALPAGAIADRVGRHPLLLAAGLSAAAGAVMLVLARDIVLLFVAGGFIAAGAGIFASSSWALATDLAPATKGALYLGLANGATVVGSIGGRLGGPLIDGINQLSHGTSLGYLVVFGLAALFFAGSSGVVFLIPQQRR